MVRRLAVVLLVPAMLIVGCSGGDDDVASSTTFAPPETNPPVPTSSSSSQVSGENDTTTTSAGSAGTTAPTTSDPVTTSTSSSMVTVTTAPDDTTATTSPDEFDWVEIVQGLYDTLAYINTSPTTERIDEFCVAVESPCRNKQGAQIEALVRDGWHVVDPVPIPVLSAEFVTTVDDLEPLESTLVVLNVVVGPREGIVGTIVDGNDEVLFEVTDETTGPTTVSWFVRFETGAGWRVFETRGND